MKQRISQADVSYSTKQAATKVLEALRREGFFKGEPSCHWDSYDNYIEFSDSAGRCVNVTGPYSLGWFLPDKEQFNYQDCNIAGDDCWLITPNDITCKWHEDNLEFRSVIIRKSDSKVVSRGFDKFFNWSEKPELDPFPLDATKIEFREKKDGSLLIVSCHNGEVFCRTRGTVNAESHDNGHEIEFFRKKYPRVFTLAEAYPDTSFLYEWESPTRPIVLREVREPTLTLLGAIGNETGILADSKELKIFSDIAETALAKTFSYTSIKECIEDVTAWRGKEGVVVYGWTNDGVVYLRKIKSDWYLKAHRLISGLKSIKNVLLFYLEAPEYKTLEEYVKYTEGVFDYEIAESLRSDLARVHETRLAFDKKVEKVKSVVDKVKNGEYSRKEQAEEIVSHWSDWRKSVGFAVLDNQEIDKKLKTKILLQELGDER